MSAPKYIHVGYLIDGSGEPVQENILLTIIGGVISGINSFDSENSPDQKLVTDLSHCTISPPLVDSHVHLTLSSTVDPVARKEQLAADYTVAKKLISRHLRYLFANGIFAVRDGGDKNGYVLRYKEEIHRKENNLPIILKTSGKAWHQKGRYGSMLGRSPEEGRTLDQAYAKEDDPIDQVKLINSGPNSLREYGRETPPQFELIEMTQLINLAHKQKRKVMVHANGRVPVKMALRAGCDSIEHGYFMGRENLEYMAEKQITWVPTLFAMNICTHVRINSSTERKIAARNVESQLKQVSLARELGVPIAAGTDAGCHGVLHGEALVEEMKLLMEGGYSHLEAMQCGSYNGAQLLGIDSLGMLAKEKPAHFLVSRGTPTQLPGKLAYLEAIYINGSPIPSIQNKKNGP